MIKGTSSIISFIFYIILVNIMFRVMLTGVEDGLLKTIVAHGSAMLIDAIFMLSFTYVFYYAVNQAYNSGDYISSINRLRLGKPIVSLWGEPTGLEVAILFDAKEYSAAEQIVLQNIEKIENTKLIAIYASVLALVENHRGNSAQSIHYLEKVCERHNDFGAAHMYLAHFYLEQNLAQKATIILNKMFMNKKRIEGENTLAHLEIAFARALAQSGKPQESLDMLKQGLQKIDKKNVPAVAEAHYWAGRIFHENNRLDQAAKHYKRAASVDPNGHWGYSAKLSIHSINMQQRPQSKPRIKTDSILRHFEE